MKREMELDAKRTNEHITLSADHPVRKLLFRMRERHCSRIFPSPLFADIERVSCGIQNHILNTNSRVFAVSIFVEIRPINPYSSSTNQRWEVVVVVVVVVMVVVPHCSQIIFRHRRLVRSALAIAGHTISCHESQPMKKTTLQFGWRITTAGTVLFLPIQDNRLIFFSR